MKNKLLGGLALSTLLASATPAPARLPKVGEPAPDFIVTLIDGTKVTRDQLRGQVVVLNFWATWCGPCRQELPTLDRYYQLRKDAGLKVFAVTTLDSAPIYQLRKLFAAMNIPAARKISGEYGEVTSVPTNYVIDRTGRVRYAKAGSFDLDELNAVLIPLLNEPSPVSAVSGKQ